MSYYQPQPTKNRTTIWVGLAVVLVALLAVGAYLLGRDSGGTATSGDPTTATAPAISWSVVGGQPVPTSPAHGPRTTEDGRAVGFSHDAQGAALAAVNIGVQLTSEAGPQVYEATARKQCFGDVDSEIEQIRNSFSNAPAGAAKPSEVWYRVSSGNPTGDLALISIALKTPQSMTFGGYAGLDMTMRWVAGDWKMQVPLARPSVIPSVQGFTLLGRPNV